MDGKIRRFDKKIGPNAGHQLFLAHKLAWAFKQDHQDLQSAAAEGHWLVAF
jgi:hypothetical protein